jgi:hypothetical protein
MSEKRCGKVDSSSHPFTCGCPKAPCSNEAFHLPAVADKSIGSRVSERRQGIAVSPSLPFVSTQRLLKRGLARGLSRGPRSSAACAVTYPALEDPRFRAAPQAAHRAGAAGGMREGGCRRQSGAERVVQVERARAQDRCLSAGGLDLWYSLTSPRMDFPNFVWYRAPRNSVRCGCHPGLCGPEAAREICVVRYEIGKVLVVQDRFCGGLSSTGRDAKRPASFTPQRRDGGRT